MKKTLLIPAIISVLVNCGARKEESPLPLLDKAAFETVIDGKPVSLYTLTNSNGAVLQLTNYGCRILALWVPDRDGVMRDVVWGYDSIEATLAGDLNSGPVVGRYGNRIAGGRFTLDGMEYQLETNNGPNHLHGGRNGWATKVWDAKVVKSDVRGGSDRVEMTLVSPDGDEKYPGTVIIKVTYSFNSDNAVQIHYEATTDAPTVLNPTNHAYFNLHGTANETILSHIMTIHADAFTPVDRGGIPTGEIRSVNGTSLDFRTPTAIGIGMASEYKNPDASRGYDHNWVLNRKPARQNRDFWHAAEVYEPATGIAMDVFTTEPGMQVYTCNGVNPNDRGKYGEVRTRHSGIALETQHFPDSPNHPDFPSTVLRPGQTFTSHTIYRFFTK